MGQPNSAGISVDPTGKDLWNKSESVNTLESEKSCY